MNIHHNCNNGYVLHNDSEIVFFNVILHTIYTLIELCDTIEIELLNNFRREMGAK